MNKHAHFAKRRPRWPKYRRPHRPVPLTRIQQIGVYFVKALGAVYFVVMNILACRLLLHIYDVLSPGHQAFPEDGSPLLLMMLFALFVLPAVVFDFLAVKRVNELIRGVSERR